MLDQDFTTDRRTLLRGLFLGLGAAAMPAWLPTAARAAAPGGRELKLPAGPLANIGPVEKKTLTGGALTGVDDLVFAPPGFSVRCVARAGLNPLTGTVNPTGFQWHVNPDGGAVFPVKSDGGWVYVSNSEINPAGGAGALRFSANGTLVAAYPILTGTRQNCAGGPTPWGTWLSCEEVSDGQVYECDPLGTPAAAVVKPALGAFPHEAVAIDPRYHVAYLTEDGGAQRFRRFVSDAADLSTTADGTTRMGLAKGRLQRLKIEGFADGAKPTEAQIREALKVTWVDDTGTNGTLFSGGEGVYYYEVPEALRAVPALGSKPTRGVIFFACKGDNRVYALDIENQLLELIFDNANMQLTTGFDDVDNVTVSPAGDVLVAEDGEMMRLYVIVPNKPAKLLVQITKGGSEIAGPAFTPDGSRLYFSSQRGPSGATGQQPMGATFELTIPPEFRRRNDPTPFTFLEQKGVKAGMPAASEAVRLAGFTGSLPLAVSQGAEVQLNGGAWTAGAGTAKAGDSLVVRHAAASGEGGVTESVVSLGAYDTVFRTVSAAVDRTPDPIDFPTMLNVLPGVVVESPAIVPQGFERAINVAAGSGQEYRIGSGPWTRATGLLSPGQAVQVRHLSSKQKLGYAKTTLRLGPVNASFVTRTR